MTELITLSYLPYKTAIGRLHLVASDTHLMVLAFDENWPKIKTRLERDAERNGKKLKLVKDENKLIKKTLSQVGQFMLQERTEFSIPCAPLGTDFEKKAWSELGKIPYGHIATYQEQAQKLKRPLAVRAVAAANGRNPISILIPCHRVLGKNGHLTGYAGGLELKQELLEVEGLTF